LVTQITEPSFAAIEPCDWAAMIPPAAVHVLSDEMRLRAWTAHMTGHHAPDRVISAADRVANNER